MRQHLIRLLKNITNPNILQMLYRVNNRLKIPMRDEDAYARFTRHLIGIEIGGPSNLFRYELPLYREVAQLDGVNFSNQTIWEGSLSAGLTFDFFGDRKGRQFISEATDLAEIGDGHYDFVLSSNCLEHVANPLKALREWYRILRGGGALILVLPDKRSNFDHRRAFTSFEHLLEDYENGMGEDDLTHLDEIMRYHDLSRDPEAGGSESFRKRSLDNYSTRSLHHHVFDLELMARAVEFAGFKAAHTSTTSNNFVMLAIKDVGSDW